VIKTGVLLAVAPRWSEPMKSGKIERRDQVLIGFCALLATAFSALLPVMVDKGPLRASHLPTFTSCDDTIMTCVRFVVSGTVTLVKYPDATG
jgi:hypothetical protein